MNTTSESLLFRLQHSPDGDVDQNAWEKFVQLYTPLMFYWARKVGLQQSDAADLVQDVLGIVFRRLSDFQYEASGSFRGWLRTVTLNKFREKKRKRVTEVNIASNSVLEQISSLQRAESTWDLDYGRMLLLQTMALMEQDFQPETWKALRAIMAEGSTVDQAAEATGVSIWSIYSAKARLMKRLREELKGLL
jgi:RNA polymerase sigma-70 factor (ECF subfamily)